MAEKQLTLEDLARAEAAALRRREQTREQIAEGMKRVVQELPEKFFAIAKQVKDGVKRFNDTAFAESGSQARLLKYEESVAVTTRDANIGGDFTVKVSRDPNWFILVLTNLWRPHSADTFIIEGTGSLGIKPSAQPFALRIDGLVGGEGELIYRAVVNSAKLDTPLDELGERLVMAVITSQIERLWNAPPAFGE